MAMTDRKEPGEGTLKYRRERRRRGIGFVASMIVAAVATAILAFAGRSGDGTPGSVDAVHAVLIALLFVGGVIASMWFYLRDADEVEWANNMSGGFFGLMVLVMLYPVWLILWLGGVAPRPDAQGLWSAAILASAAGYLWKKFR